jgi:tRNA (adenine58-N1)-methyltransferase non-catalytic subunit
LQRTSISVTSLYEDKIKDHALKYFGYSNKKNDRVVNLVASEVTEVFDSLVITGKDGIFDLVLKLWPYLKGSGAFVAYHQDLVEAAKTYEWIMTHFNTANVIFEEIWSRNFQVLPQRTHPDVQTRVGSSGGYLISAIKLSD